MAGGCDLPLRRRPPQPRRPQPPLPARQRLPRREAWQAAVVATRLGVGVGVGGGRGGAGGQTFSVWAAAGNVRGLGRLGWGTVVRRACVCRARLKSRIGQTTAKRGTLAALPSHVTACAWAARASRAAHRAHRRVPSAAVGELSATHTPPPPPFPTSFRIHGRFCSGGHVLLSFFQRGEAREGLSSAAATVGGGGAGRAGGKGEGACLPPVDSVAGRSGLPTPPPQGPARPTASLHRCVEGGSVSRLAGGKRAVGVGRRWGGGR